MSRWPNYLVTFLRLFRTYQKLFGKSLTKTASFFVQICRTDIRWWCHQLQHPPEKTFPPHFSNTHYRKPNSIPRSKCCPICPSYRIPIRCISRDQWSFERALPFINRIHKACYSVFWRTNKATILMHKPTKNKNSIKS